MSRGTKIGLVAILILTVVLAAVILDNDIEKAPSAKEQAAADRGVAPTQRTVRDGGRAGRDQVNRNQPSRNQASRNQANRNQANRNQANRNQANRISGNSNTPTSKSTGEASPAQTPIQSGMGSNQGNAKNSASTSGNITNSNLSKNGVLRPTKEEPALPTMGRGATSGTNPSKMKAARNEKVGQPVPAITKKGEPEKLAGSSARKEPLGNKKPARKDGFPRKYEVQDGDNLWNLARRIYGDPTVFEEIRAANPQLADADALTVGDELTLPIITAKKMSSKSTIAKKTSSGKNDYVIKDGDTLYDLAAKFLGDANRWPEIEKANPGLDADLIIVGTTIRIPAR